MSPAAESARPAAVLWVQHFAVDTVGVLQFASDELAGVQGVLAAVVWSKTYTSSS